MNLSMKQKQTHRGQTCCCQGEGGRMDWEFGISRCRPLYIGLINKKILPYGIANYIQYPVLAIRAKNIKKNACMCMCGYAYI